MFLKSKNKDNKVRPLSKKEGAPSIIAEGLNILGNIVSDGVVDFNGSLDGNIRARSIMVRPDAVIKGEVVADSVAVYGTVKGLIRAQDVHLYASCNVEGIIMHEALTIEDGATVDGKFKRTNKLQSDEDEGSSSVPFAEELPSAAGGIKMLENIRLIR